VSLSKTLHPELPVGSERKPETPETHLRARGHRRGGGRRERGREQGEGEEGHIMNKYECTRRCRSVFSKPDLLPVVLLSFN